MTFVLAREDGMIDSLLIYADQIELQYVIWEGEAFGDWQLKRSGGTAITNLIHYRAVLGVRVIGFGSLGVGRIEGASRVMRKKKPEIERLCSSSTDDPWPC